MTVRCCNLSPKAPDGTQWECELPDRHEGDHECAAPGAVIMWQTAPSVCMDCGMDYDDFPIDLLLPRSQWLDIHPDDDGLLCACCIVKRVAAKISRATAIHAVVEVAPVGTMDEWRTLRNSMEEAWKS